PHAAATNTPATSNARTRNQVPLPRPMDAFPPCVFVAGSAPTNDCWHAPTPCDRGQDHSRTETSPRWQVAGRSGRRWRRGGSALGRDGPVGAQPMPEQQARRRPRLLVVLDGDLAVDED